MPPRTSSREPSLNGDGRIANASGEQEAAGAGQNLGVPGSGVGGDAPNDKAESIGRGSKRSLTGRRKRDESTASKTSAQQPTAVNEKDARPASSGRTAAADQARPKKKGGFLSFLNCCAGSDESQDVGQGAQPAKSTKPQPVRAQQPAQMRQQQPNQPQQDVSTEGTSTEDSKEVVDEKSAQPAYQDAPAAVPIVPAAEAQNPPSGDATDDKPTPNVPAGTSSAPPNPQVRPLEADRQMVPEQPTTGPPHIDTSTQTPEPSSSASPQVQVQAPTPVVPQSEEDEMILDRTPEQAARDNDIEMSDAGPSLPLSGQDAALVVEEEKQAHERRESSGVKQDDLPPPPPLPNKQEQGHDGAAPSQDTSLVSTPEQSQKWLLPPLKPELRGRKCLVLDLDETLVHSSFKVSLAFKCHSYSAY